MPDKSTLKKLTKRRAIATTILTVGFLACGWLGFGVYSDREFGDLNLFRKHRLSTHFYFYSPCGESDTPLATDSERRAEHDYIDFVERNHGRDRVGLGLNNPGQTTIV